MSSEGSREIEAAKQRLAVAKKWQAFAESNERSARKTRDDSEREIKIAQNALDAAEKRWEVIEIDSPEDNDRQLGNKRRKLESEYDCKLTTENGAATAVTQVDKKSKTMGCFVYQVTIEEGICVRSSPPTLSDDSARTPIIFERNDLVSVDLIRPSRFANSTIGPYLRCTDDSGWIFENQDGAEVAKRIPVEIGLWTFYVDHRGTTLRCHPFPGKRRYVGSFAALKPMQLIYCDRRVVSPHHQVASYRVQGTDGWVSEKDEDGTIILLAEDKVKVPPEGELFVYEVLGEDIKPCKEPSSVGDTGIQLPVVFKAGDVVVCDMVRKSPCNHFSVQHLRLSDGLGWLHEQTNNSQGRLRQLLIEKGKWTLKVNSPAGIALCRHPMDRADVMTSVTLQPGEHVTCDMRVRPSPGPATFYHVAGKEGWVFDRNDSCVMMELIPESEQVSAIEKGWSIGFVRGLALAFQWSPAIADSSTGILSFQNDSNICIHIFYSTRSVKVENDQTQSWRRDCSDDELRDIMQNPCRYTNGLSGSPNQADQEKNQRNKLIELTEEEDHISEKKTAIMKSLQTIDGVRADAMAKMEQKVEARVKELEKIQRVKEEAERLKKERDEQRQNELEAEQRRIADVKCRTCNVCNRLFKNSYARHQHFRAVHRGRGH